MASLITFDTPVKQLTFSPVRPEYENPRDAYDIEVSVDGSVVFSGRYNVEGWQVGHYYIFILANMFRNCNQVLDETYPFRAGRFPETVDSREPMVLGFGITWASFKLVCSTYKGREVAGISAFFLAGESPRSEGLYEHFTFDCDMTAAMEFGARLYEECEAAEARREELGLLAWEES